MKTAAFALFIFGVVAILIPRTLSMQVDLSDTRQETAGLNWQRYPEEGWIEMSNDDGNGNTLRTFQVCKIQTPGQNNWVRTNYIEVGEAKNVFVEVKFSMRSCTDLDQVATCKETFNLYYLETNSLHSGRERQMNEYTYKKVDTVAADQRFPQGASAINIETRKIGPLKGKGVYIAFQDTGACMIIFYVRVYYKACDDVTQNLARFSGTVTGMHEMSLVEVTGECVENSLWTDGDDGPIMYCNSEGRWNIPSGSCQCSPGFEPTEDITECKECQPGTFKPSYSNSRCITCPDNSLSIKFASTECVCSSGYYRSKEDDPSSACTRPPSKPEMVEYVVEKTSVALSWTSPSYDGGRNDTTYSVTCLRCDSTFTLCSECGDNVDYSPSKVNLREPRVTVSDLSSHTSYRFRIFSYNGVSSVSRSEPKFSDALLKTSEAAPSAVRNVRVLERTTSEVILNWDSPSHPNGIILEYEIQYNSNGISRPMISRTNRTKDQTFRIKYLPSSTSFIVQVKARNIAGYGLMSTPIVFRTAKAPSSKPNLVTSNPIEHQIDYEYTAPNTLSRKSNDEVHLVIGIIVASTLIIIMMVAVAVICRIMRRRKKTEDDDTEIYPFFPNPVDIVSRKETVSQRTYVDPSIYGDPDEAVHKFAMEIEYSNIKKEELMASGEFGDVYKGLLRPTTPNCDEIMLLKTSLSRPTNMAVAIKTLKEGYTDKQREDFLTEASIMGQFNHPNVIRLEGVVTRTAPLMIVTEYMENGSLDTFLGNKHFNGSELTTLQLIGMLRDIADGMKYLAEMGYVHRDLAARNVLVDDSLVCKVSDFGLSRVLENIEEEGTAMYTTRGGMIPVRWTAPEAITKRTFTSSSDVWSFGIAMWEVLTLGERPYWDMPNPDVVHCVECGYRLPPPAFCPRVLHNLMLNCWNVDRTRRPTFAQIVEQLDSLLMMPERLQDTINNIPVELQAECIPESLDLSSLGQWLEDMNMTHYKDVMLRFGCVTAEQIIKLSANQLDEMGIFDLSIHRILLNGAEFLRKRLALVENQGITV